MKLLCKLIGHKWEVDPGAPYLECTRCGAWKPDPHADPCDNCDGIGQCKDCGIGMTLMKG